MSENTLDLPKTLVGRFLKMYFDEKILKAVVI